MGRAVAVFKLGGPSPELDCQVLGGHVGDFAGHCVVILEAQGACVKGRAPLRAMCLFWAFSSMLDGCSHQRRGNAGFFKGLRCQ